MEKEQGNGDYTLLDLSPHETLVEFHEDSQANPNNWSFVSYYSHYSKQTS